MHCACAGKGVYYAGQGVGRAVSCPDNREAGPDGNRTGREQDNTVGIEQEKGRTRRKAGLEGGRTGGIIFRLKQKAKRKFSLARRKQRFIY